MIFQTIPEWALKSQGDMRKRQKPMKSWPEKIPKKLLFHYTGMPSLPSIYNQFLHFQNPSNSQQKKKMRTEKQKEEVKTAVSLSKLKSISKFWFLHMPNLQKLTLNCIWNRRWQHAQPVNGSLVSLAFIARQWQENGSIGFKTCFSAKIPWGTWVNPNLILHN